MPGLLTTSVVTCRRATVRKGRDDEIVVGQCSPVLWDGFGRVVRGYERLLRREAAIERYFRGSGWGWTM